MHHEIKSMLPSLVYYNYNIYTQKPSPQNPEMSQYLSENTKTGDFNLRRTLSGSFVVIPQRLVSIHAVVLAFTANKRTDTLKYIYIDVIHIDCGVLHWCGHMCAHL